MNKKTAINIIKSQIEKLDRWHDRSLYDKIWLDQTITYLKQILGEDSEQVQHFSKIIAVKQKSDPTRLLETCIEIVDNVGVYKKPNKNILDGISNLKIITIAISIFVSGLCAGIWLSDRGIISIGAFVVTTNNIPK